MGYAQTDSRQSRRHGVADSPVYRSASGIYFLEPAAVADIQSRENAKGFDAPGATYPHKDGKGRCSFEALVDEHCSGDPVLIAMARMVRGADFAEETNLTEESAGIRTISQGFPMVTDGDHETLEKASFLYEALYASIRARQQSS